MGKKLSDFEPLWEAEARLVAWLQAGMRETFRVSGRLPPEDASKAVRIRAEFVRYLALGGCEDCAPSEKGLGIAGAYIDGDGPEGAETQGLDLEGCTLTGDLALLGCRFPDAPLLRGAQVQSLFLNGSALMQGVVADRLVARGSVFLRGVVAEGEVRLLGAKLGGDLSCTGAQFTAGASGKALNADGLEARGDVVLEGVVADGQVRLLGAKIGGNLDCEGVRLTAVNGGRALSCDDAEISGVLFLREGAEIVGVLGLMAAQIGGFCDTEACWPKELLLDRCRYGAFVGRAPVDAAARLRWLALQRPEKYGQAFWPQPYEECARVLREAGHGGAARTILIEKERLQRAAKRAGIAKELAAARKLRAKAPFENGVRLHTDKVNGAWCRLRLSQLWDGILGAVVGYGRKPQNAALWLCGFWLLGAVIFGHAGGYGAMKPNLPQVQRAPEWVQCAEGGKLRQDYSTQYHCYRAQPEARSYPQFNALVYSADVLLPVVSLEMQSYWLPDDETPIGSWARLFLWAQIIAGWALTLLAVAGFSGLIKQDSK